MMSDRASRRTLRAALLSSALVVGALVTVPKAHALPAFAMKEHKPCSYCHINPKGGGKRNANGLWYQHHKLSFAGYTREKAAKEAGVPVSAVPVDPAAKKPAPKPPAKKK